MHTKTAPLSLLLLVFSSQLSAQIYTTPPSSPPRTMAEWEELQSLVIVWNGGNSGDPWFDILSEIVRHARLETEVIICCDSLAIIDHAQNYLTDKNVDISSKVSFVVAPNNSIWVRDFGPNCVYTNDVDSLHIVDWLYNRINRPKDNAIPEILGQHFQLPVFSTSVAPYDLVNTGGNFITDGMGTAFATELILVNNDQIKNGECGNLNDVIGTSSHTESSIDQIMQDFMGIDRYVKLDQLPFDCIHHVDMHMKLLDEETLLVGQYPAGIGDGPQIESNLQYVLNNVLTAFGTRFKTIRIPMPPQNGQYPPTPGVYNRTYTNAVFVNKTILIPFYEEQFDTMAQRVWQEAMPGYKVVGINCLDLISSRGALHCITKEMGVKCGRAYKLPSNCADSASKRHCLCNGFLPPKKHQHLVDGAHVCFSAPRLC
jgi:agmatine deiminase